MIEARTLPIFTPSLPLLPPHPCCGCGHCLFLVVTTQGREVAGAADLLGLGSARHRWVSHSLSPGWDAT